MKHTIALLLGLLFLVFAHSSCRAQQEKPKAPTAFAPPSIPMAIADPDARLEYMLMHYWDNLNFADTAWIAKSEIEQAFVDYLDLFNYAKPAMIETSLKPLIKRMAIQKEGFNWFADQFDHYLFDANSPLRNEEHYAYVLASLIASPDVEEIYKSRYYYQLDMVNKNRVGSVAANFTFTKADGTTSKLHSIQSNFTLVFFYNPDCHDCLESKKKLMESETINKLIAEKEMTILAMYVYDEIELWKQNAPKMPSTWINAYDASADLVVEDQLYAIRAIPSFYLLDADKKVLLRDGVVEQVIGGFQGE
ncbi:MAG: DUF5106 domain-containing protein [Mangrovibacterium sp.]